MKLYIQLGRKENNSRSESVYWVVNEDKSEYFHLGNAFNAALLVKFLEYLEIDVIRLNSVEDADFHRIMIAKGYKLPQ